MDEKHASLLLKRAKYRLVQQLSDPLNKHWEHFIPSTDITSTAISSTDDDEGCLSLNVLCIDVNSRQNDCIQNDCTDKMTVYR